MDPALIAVIGTLGGVVVTSASGITVAWFTARIQRDNIDHQRAHDIAEHRRAERRETSVEYLAASASFAKGTGDARAPRTSRRQARQIFPARGRPLQPRLPSPPTSRSPLTERSWYCRARTAAANWDTVGAAAAGASSCPVDTRHREPPGP